MSERPWFLAADPADPALERIASALERIADAADLWAKPSISPYSRYDVMRPEVDYYEKPPPPNPGLRSDRGRHRWKKANPQQATWKPGDEYDLDRQP